MLPTQRTPRKTSLYDHTVFLYGANCCRAGLMMAIAAG